MTVEEPPTPLEESSPIAMACRDELPETYDALSDAPTFGDAALKRRLDTLLYRAYGDVLDEAEQGALSPLMVSYLGKRLALDLIIPGIDYWSKQALSHSAGDRESKAYKDRAEDLKELRKLLLEETSALLGEVEAELPLIPRRAADTVKVLEAGFSTAHVTADPFGYPPQYGPPEETTTG
jgi:hypothetical protein